MSEEHPECLTREESAAYSSLRSEAALPSGLEDRVVDELAGRGLIAHEHGALERLADWFRGIPLAPRMGLAMAALAGTFVLGVGVGRQADDPVVPEALLEPPAVGSEEDLDGGGIMVADWQESGAETSYVQLSVVARPMPDENEAGDFRPYPLDGEIRPYSVSR